MIVVAGENLVDIVVDGTGSVTARVGGGPCNTARAVARLGQRAAYLGAISNDVFGRMIRGNFERDGVNLQLAMTRDEPSTLAVAELDSGGAATYNFYSEHTAAPLVDVSDWDALGDVDALHIGTLGLVLEPMASNFAALVNELGKQTTLMVDPNCRGAAIENREPYIERMNTILKRADIVKVSDEDLAYLAPGVDTIEAAMNVVDNGAFVVLVTTGGEQVSVITAERRADIVPPTVEVVDTIGAGDSFGAGFLAYWVKHGWSCGNPPPFDELVRAAEFAALVGATTCQVVGADPPTAAELPPF